MSDALQLKDVNTLTFTAPVGGTGRSGRSGGLLPAHGHDASALIVLMTPVLASSPNMQSTTTTSVASGSAMTGYSQHAAVVPVPKY